MQRQYLNVNCRRGTANRTGFMATQPLAEMVNLTGVPPDLLDVDQTLLHGPPITYSKLRLLQRSEPRARTCENPVEDGIMLELYHRRVVTRIASVATSHSL